MPQHVSELPRTLGELRTSAFPEERLARRTVKDELRANLICKLQRREELFPGIVGYEDSVVPQVVNAILSRHNFILLGLRGQAKTRIIRSLTGLLDEWMPIVAGSEINDDPYAPVSSHARHLIKRIAQTPRATSGSRADLAQILEQLRRPPRRRGLVAVRPLAARCTP